MTQINHVIPLASDVAPPYHSDAHGNPRLWKQFMHATEYEQWQPNNWGLAKDILLGPPGLSSPDPNWVLSFFAKRVCEDGQPMVNKFGPIQHLPQDGTYRMEYLNARVPATR